MLPLIGLLVAAYTVARSVAEVTAHPNGAISIVGRVAFGLCGIVSVFLAFVLYTSGASATTP